MPFTSENPQAEAIMLQNVDMGERSLKTYQDIVDDEILTELYRISKDLKGLRVLHLNATPYGGGVAELLRSVVPLLNDLGLVADWKTISGDNRFFDITKIIHNALQGGKQVLNDEQQNYYIRVAIENAEMQEEEYDVVFVHDPQPLPIPGMKGNTNSRWIWRCHIDSSNPDGRVWAFLKEWTKSYDAAVFTMDDFVPSDFPVKEVEIIPPAIDPLSPKNFFLEESISRQILEWIGIRLDSPLITQVARFDPWKDPLGVIEAYRMARKEIPNIQLALVGSMALDDPEGWTIYEKIRKESERDSLIHVFNPWVIGNLSDSAFLASLGDLFRIVGTEYSRIERTEIFLIKKRLAHLWTEDVDIIFPDGFELLRREYRRFFSHKKGRIPAFCCPCMG
jgi:trehalose synthase